MATINRSTPYVMETTSATMLAKRAVVSDRIRHLSPADPLLMFVSKGYNKAGYVKQNGFMGKKEVTRLDVEAFYSLPKEYILTPTVVDSLNLTFASVDEIVPRMVFRAKNGTTGVVLGVNTSTKVVTFATLGSTTFSVTLGESIQYLGVLAEENSRLNDYVGKSDDRVYNVCGNFRHGLGISGHQFLSGMAGMLAGGNYYDRKCKEEYEHAMHAFEASMLFGNLPASGSGTAVTTTTGTNAGLITLPHNKGLYNYAQNTYDFAGSPSLEKLLFNLPKEIHNSCNPTSELLFLMSNDLFDTFNNLVFSKAQFTAKEAENKLEKYGVACKSFMTSRGKLTCAVSHAFSNTLNSDTGLIISPDDINYCYFKDKDVFLTKEGLEENDRDGKKGEISFCGCLLPLCGGYKITKVINAL